MMTIEEHELFEAVCAGRDKLSDKYDAMKDSRDIWRGACIVMIVLAALDIISEWAGWTL